MKLQPDEVVWCPAIHVPDYLSLLRQGQRPPAKAEDFLRLQVNLFNRLVQQASEGEVADASRRLDRDLPPEALAFLPTGLLTNPQTPNLLLLNPQVEGSPLHQWKVNFPRALRAHLLPPAQAKEQAQSLSLESFLGRLLE